MRIVSTSYSKTEAFDDPLAWLKRINFYTGILDELARKNKVFSIERINYEGAYQQNGVQYHFIKLQKKVVRFPWRMHRLIKTFRPDVVLVNGLVFPLQIIQLRILLGNKIKIIVLHRAEKPFTGIKRSLQRLADGCIDAYLFTSLAFKEPWKKNIDISKIHEIIQASSAFEITDKLNARKQTGITGNPVFLFVGRLDSNKDPLAVVGAFCEFLKQQPHARLYLIYQEGHLLQEVIDLIGSNETGESIFLVGKVPHCQMQYWYNSAEFIISGSHYEGSGVSVSEAMSCGCIPIVTDIPSFRSMTGQGKCAFLFDPGNKEELLAALLKTREIDIEISKAKVLQQFRKELSFEAIANKINSIISK